MLIELTPVEGNAFEIEESNIFIGESVGDNVMIRYKQPDSDVMQEILVTDTVDELNDTSVAASGTLFGTKIIKDGITHIVLLNQTHTKKVFDTNPCQVNYNLGTASINEILVHDGNKPSFLKDYNGDFSPSV